MSFQEHTSKKTSEDISGLTLEALESMRKKLLDLTARNRLLNFPVQQKGSSIRLVGVDAGNLYYRLISDKSVRFYSVPQPSKKELIEFGYLEEDKETGEFKKLKADPDAKTWAKEMGFSIDYEFVENSGRSEDTLNMSESVQVLYYAPEMEARLRNIRSKANTAIEEMGAGILFLSLGFLEWYEREGSSQPRLAPLFNIPVYLKRGLIDKNTGVYQYTIHYTGEDIISNLSLREKLFMDFGMSLPDINEENSPEEYLKLVKSQVEKSKPGWKVKENGALTLLNFGKMLMYLDLDQDRWPKGDQNITQHPVIDRFFRSQETTGTEGGLGISPEHHIDDMPEIHSSFPLIDDADSSQHSAMIDALKGDNLVIEGPPGTGKSQTIMNLIAAAMCLGKKVLFVAEKMAALEVVKKRLDDAGLGVFCLELHSHKSQKKKVLADLQERLTCQKRLRSSRSVDAEISRYEQLKEDLNSYSEEINSKWGNTGKTIHEIFSAAARYRTEAKVAAQDLWVNDLSGDNFDEVKRLQLRDQVREFKEIHTEMKRQIGEGKSIELHPWYGIESGSIALYDSDKVVSLLEFWQAAIKDLAEESESIVRYLRLDGFEIVEGSEAEELATDFKSLPMLSGDELVTALSNLDADTCKAVEYCLEEFEEIQRVYYRLMSAVRKDRLNEISAGYSSSELVDLVEVSGVNADIELNELAKNIQKIFNIHQELVKNSESLHDLKDALPPNLSEHVGFGKVGLINTHELLGLISKVDVKNLSFRSDQLDDADVDVALDEVASWLGKLIPQREMVARAFNINRLPVATELEHLKSEIGRPGIGKWFSGNWWEARKRLMSLTSGKTKVSALLNSIDGAISYKKSCEKFEECHYEKVLGSHYRGLETNVNALSELRDWYKSVRSKYGFGFGKRAALADEILNLPVGIIKGAQNLCELGVDNNLNFIISELDRQDKFVPLVGQQLERSKNLLEGKESAYEIASNMSQEIGNYQELLDSPNITVGDAVHTFGLIRDVRKRQESWESTNIISNVFGKDIALEFGPEANNGIMLKKLYATINFSIYVHNNIKNEKLKDVLLSVQNYEEFNDIVDRSKKYVELWKRFSEGRRLLYDEAGLNYNQWICMAGDDFGRLIRRNEKAISRKDWLNDWVNYIRIKFEMADSGLSKIWFKVSSGEIDVEVAEKALYSAVFNQLANEIISQRPHLSRVSGKSQQAKQNTFRQYDEKLKELQRERIASKVSEHRAPLGISGGKKSEYTEMALINNEIGKKTKHIPIRQLLDRAGGAIQELKPCFMMGPMSAAQYIAPGRLDFDIVVMDEASQVKPEDALGVIARGKQLVVVGDPKQLPPTNFFDRQDVGDDDDDSVEVASTSSILDAALPLFKMRRLRWHYRSQHESLIAFSNRNFYHNDLVIFPSPNPFSEEYGIKFQYVPSGRFINQHNINESRAVAKAAVKHAFSNPQESLGIVAMNSKQREQIERAIDEECKLNERVSEAIEFLREREDGLFVKNLENVQGDERDVIFISFTYGPSEAGGRVYQRFGPINSDVGWRRLNVLFTRSKKRMHVFSSMHHDDILTNERSSKGVIAFSDFLKYAEHGKLDSATAHTGKSPDSDFEVAVIDALTDQGFECEPQVGVAGFFIDIAVKDPGKPGRYLMGIECDGATYHSAKSARDRDRLRQEVLEGLGWRIRRIWSTDWFINPTGELQPIIRELNDLKTDCADPVVKDTTVEDMERLEDDSAFVEMGDDDLALNDFHSASELSLREQLEEVAEKVILKDFPGTPKERRLLRPAMIETLVEHEPVGRSEFVECVPEYIRKSTDVDEAKKYLDFVLNLIAGNESEG